MKKSVWIVLAFIGLSLVLTVIWNEWVRELYASFFSAVAPPVYRAIGFEDVPIVSRRLRYINFVPFIGLVLVTPGLSPRRRSIGLGLGLLAIFASHLVLNLMSVLQPGSALPMPTIPFSDALPFLIWIIVAHPTLRRFLPGASHEDPTHGPREDPPEDPSIPTHPSKPNT